MTDFPLHGLQLKDVYKRQVYRCKIPIISAVGHEIDFCICDFVADMRAETPTAAAETAVPDDKILKDNINNLKTQLSSCLKGKLEYSKLLSDTYIKEAENSLIRKIDGLRYSLERHLLTLQENLSLIHISLTENMKKLLNL